MKTLFGLLILLSSFTANAGATEASPNILFSCSGITYDNKHALHLTVTELGPNYLRAVVHATNGEAASVAMRHGFGMLVPIDPRLRFFIRLRGHNDVTLNWEAEVLGPQYSHQPMTCANGSEL